MAVDPQETKVPVVLTIAGSDSGSGAGIQADLKTFAAHGVHGTSAITAVTAQNTLGVTAVQEVDLDVIAAQIDAVVEDMHPVAVKTGMLSSPEIVRLVAAKANEYGWQTLVVDPVMVASSGARLLRDEAVETYRTELLPLAAVTTPNLLEATELTGIEIASSGDAREAAKAISVLGVKYVVVKGGHMEVAGESRDLLYDGRDFVEFGLPWIDTTSTHGTGCTFASAIAAQLALGGDIESAFRSAKKFVWEAMNAAYPVGQGHGPLNQMWRMPPEED
ncbi:MAG TPA: bifunctional hydroxymethylpyrimidine kinase/phosphomethylpyrimidine kinase [Dehalococcoidia bacterium]|nr:bifunctional hydroxymethylpyrimidine kinase/phosphomethylpyrimidine kinase [Chloroflexota bacterium]HIM60965.1 bifunctional hydroxymethylpyrimidine kinase/phosphomethylpyrimidine kinase [Dehalococcoidia bacterium]